MNFVNNGAFVQELIDAEIHPQRDLDDYLFERAELENVTAAVVQGYVDTHLGPDQYIQVTVEPR